MRKRVNKPELFLASCAAVLIGLGGCASRVEKQRELQWRQAYQQQAEQLQVAGPVLGYKAGLSTKQSRQRFHSDRAVAGNLYRLHDQSQPLNADGFLKPMIEVELAFRLKRAVEKPIGSIAKLQDLVAEVAPALELPDIGLVKNRPPSPQDIVRSNIAAHTAVIGAPMPLNLACLENIDSRLWQSGDLLVEANSQSLEGGTWQALLRLINNRIDNGWPIQPQHWLLTGALSAMRPLQGEEYVADFHCAGQPLGRVQLLVMASQGARQ